MKSVKVDQGYITPSKIICVGRNYVDHISELGNEVPDNMVLFFKPNAAIGSQLFSYQQETIHYEAELCFLYQQGKFSALAVGLDLTKRALQTELKNKGLPWERAKAFSNSALFSDFVYIDHVEQNFELQLDINDKRQQTATVKMMLHSPQSILKEVLSFIELEDGDIVMTGTPAGVGKVKRGDVFTGRVLIADDIIITKQWRAS